MELKFWGRRIVVIILNIKYIYYNFHEKNIDIEVYLEKNFCRWVKFNYYFTLNSIFYNFFEKIIKIEAYFFLKI